MASSPITSWQKDGEAMEIVRDYFLGLQNHCGWWLQPYNYTNSCPLSQGCHPTISSSVVPFSSHLQSFPASGSFQKSQLFTSGGQSIAVSASESVLPINIQDRFHLEWTGWISLQSKGLLKSLQQHSSTASILWPSAFFTVQLSHPYMTTGKP